ncbi:MAG: hypothetical protein AAGJ18_20700 [Bacteroidota bacterium]
MIQDAYRLYRANNKLEFQFESTGKNGIIQKIILYQPIGKNRFNLAFGDRKGNDIDDKVVSNNGDLIKVVSTVALSVYQFFEDNPTATIEIQGVDMKRLRLYNHIFKRKKTEIETLFILKGDLGDDKLIPVETDQFYTKFVVKNKIS